MTNPIEPAAPTHRRLLPLALAGALALAIGVTACGDDSEPTDAQGSTTESTTESTTATTADPYGGATSPADGGADAAAGPTVTAEGFAFSELTVAPNAEFTFANADGATHTLTADDGSFDSASVAAGESTTLAAPSTPGTYAFHCEIHPSMAGTLTVEG